MTNEECFEAWAPDGVFWSQWTKPILFARLQPATRLDPPEQKSDADVSWAPNPRGDTAIVVDLPGAQSVRVGLALARLGYRPVPLYNASDGPSAVIDVGPLTRALAAGAQTVREATLRPDAPPTFLLDADRMRPRMQPGPGRFDNRWVVFPQDFPSATMLLSRGIREVVLVHAGDAAPQEDLAHVLLRWRNAGIRLLGVEAGRADRPRELAVRPPSLFRRAWYRVVTVMGLTRNDAGGFGATIPVPSAGGGGGFTGGFG
jgi:hypothetical protein